MKQSVFLLFALLFSAIGFSQSRVTQGLDSEFLYTIEIDVDTAVNVGSTPLGNRIFYKALGGRIKGPKLNGKVLPTGGDYALQLENTLKLEVRLIIETDEGELIYNTYNGYLHENPDGSPYWRVSFLYETSSKKYDWLNRIIAIGVGRGEAGKAVYDVYAIR